MGQRFWRVGTDDCEHAKFSHLVDFYDMTSSDGMPDFDFRYLNMADLSEAHLAWFHTYFVRLGESGKYVADWLEKAIKNKWKVEISL